MAFDPLSRSTRSSKRMLLLAVVLAFVIDLFHITLTDFPLGGFQNRIDPGVLPLVIFIIVLYFAIAFGIAAFDDVMNTPTPHVLETYNGELLARLYIGMGEAEKTITDYLSERGVERGPAMRISRNVSFHAKNMFPSNPPREVIEQIVYRPLDTKTREALPDAGIDIGHILADVVAPILKDYRRPKIGPYLHFFYARLYGFEIALPAVLAFSMLILYFSKIDFSWLGRLSGGGNGG